MSFPELVEVALAGTLRQEPKATLPVHQTLAPESRLLRAAAYEGLRRLAGRQIERANADVALPVEPAKAELLAEVPPPASVRLLEILAGRTDLLGEWLQLAIARNLRVPAICLPDLLEHARGEGPDLRETVVEVGGERMVWLAKLNSDWQFAAYADPEQELALGPTDQRPGALRRLRRRDPTRARELLLEVWPSERGESRANLLTALATGLSAEDEPVIAQAVRDPRRIVRDAALRLIRRIPNSHFGQRWTQRARRVFIFDNASPRLEIREPATVHPDWLADGLDPRPPKGIGTTAWLLQEVLALTPPSLWPQPAALDAIQRADWAGPLLAGLARAAETYADAGWCEALLLAQTQAQPSPEAPALDMQALFRALQPEHAEAVLRRLLDLNPGLTGSLAGARTEPWSEEFSRFVVDNLSRLLDKHQYALLAFLREAPLRLAPCVVADVERLLDEDIEPLWLRPVLDRLVHTLDDRLAMRREFDG